MGNSSWLNERKDSFWLLKGMNWPWTDELQGKIPSSSSSISISITKSIPLMRKPSILLFLTEFMKSILVFVIFLIQYLPATMFLSKFISFIARLSCLQIVATERHLVMTLRQIFSHNLSCNVWCQIQRDQFHLSNNISVSIRKWSIMW